ncbi:serine/arginine repetitive matrix protein 1-like [Cinclus cinclus]|uniref:serine/arginine repetitive matrix protein 1-like n=1 Tax=Cinclus cinclus TaxID=127875 RepID=UPI002E1352A7
MVSLKVACLNPTPDADRALSRRLSHEPFPAPLTSPRPSAPRKRRRKIAPRTRDRFRDRIQAGEFNNRQCRGPSFSPPETKMAEAPEMASASTKDGGREGRKLRLDPSQDGDSTVTRPTFCIGRQKRGGEKRTPTGCGLHCLPATPTPIPPPRRDFARRFPSCPHGLWAQRRRGRAGARRAPTGSGGSAPLSAGVLPRPPSRRATPVPPRHLSALPGSAPARGTHRRRKSGRPAPGAIALPAAGSSPQEEAAALSAGEDRRNGSTPPIFAKSCAV